MPYNIKKQGDEYCVFNSDTGDNKGCSDSRAKAIRHMRAMYAAEGGASMGKKELDRQVAQAVLEFLADPASAGEPLQLEDLVKELAEEPEEPQATEVQATASLTFVPDAFISPDITVTTVTTAGDLPTLTIVPDPIPDPILPESPAVVTAAKELDEEDTFVERILSKIKSLFQRSKMPPASLLDRSGLLLWKEADGQYHWASRYSNNFRDDDRPREIISADSHRRFVDLVDKGLASMPELWLWHVPEWKFGEANWLAFDESGFALAAGLVDKDKSFVAEWLAERNDFLTSHGMPYASLQRDPVDPTIIKEHVTVEISPLPGWSAANKLTDFVIPDGYMNKENDMAIPNEKRQALIDMGFKPEWLDKLEAINAETKAMAEQVGLESKEITPEPAPETPAETPAEVKEAAPAEVITETPAPETETPAPDQSPVTRVEVAEAVANVIGGRLVELEGLVSQIDASMKSLTADLASMKEQNVQVEKAVEKAVEELPPASMAALLAQRMSAIGSKEASVDGRSSLARSKPKEAPAQSAGPIGIPFLDSMLSAKREE